MKSRNVDSGTVGKDAPTILLSTGMGIGIRYFFQTDIVPSLLRAGARVVCVVPNPQEALQDLAPELRGVIVETLKEDRTVHRRSKLGRLRDSCIGYLRATGLSRESNLAVARFLEEATAVQMNTRWTRRLFPLLRATSRMMQRSHTTRRLFVSYLARRPVQNLHSSLFEKYNPSLVVVSSPGWFANDEQMLREARSHGRRSVALVVGWDHTSSKGLAAPIPDRIAVWSEIQKQELVRGCDIDPARVDVVGVAHFDSYFQRKLEASRQEYFEQHGLDPARRLITFACSFVSMSSNVGVVQVLAEAMAQKRFRFPVQLLVRLHPTHFKKPGKVLSEVLEEVEAFKRMAEKHPHMRLDYPVLNSKEVAMSTAKADRVALMSLLRHSDVFVTLFSTMVLEAAINDTPTVCAALEPPSAWQRERWFSVRRALDWPTHERIRSSGASAVAFTEEELVAAVNKYLEAPRLHAEGRRRLAADECTYVDGRSGQRIGEYLWRLGSRENGFTPNVG